MKLLSASLTLLTLSLPLLIGCQKSGSTDPNPASAGTPAGTTFSPANYAEYVTCKVGNTVFTSGNKALTSASITITFAGSWLYIDANNGEFIPGNVAPAEVNLQLGNFSKTAVKDYDISGIAPLEVRKLNGTGSGNLGDYFSSNDASGSTTQAKAIKITQIKDGFLYGTFACKVYNTNDRTKTADLTEGSFKVHIPN